MKVPQFFVLKKKKSPIKTIAAVASAVVATATAAAIVYKTVKSKKRSDVIGGMDLNGDGSNDAVMLDTTGNGEIDTIVLNAEEIGDNALEKDKDQ